MAKEKKIHLPDLPQDEYYEDLVAALLCAGGYYIEKRIDLREPTNVLELDVVTSKYYPDHVDKTLSEIKSAGWGFPDVFKVRGWLDFLSLPKASFVCLNSNKSDFAQIQQVAKKLNIDLLEIVIQDKKIDEDNLLQAYNIVVTDRKLYDCAASSIRFALCCERIMVNKYYKPLVKDPKALHSYICANDFLYMVCEHSFFQNNVYERIKEVFDAFIKYKNLTARMDTERINGSYPDPDDATLSKDSFSKLFYKCLAEKNPLHIALYAELMCRITMLQLSVEESYRDKEMKGIMRTIERLGIPNNIKDGIIALQSNHKYYYLYPHFWQIFIYVFGGFILDEKKEQEYEMLSKLTGIPIDEIPNTLMAFDILFPIDGSSWLFTNTYSNITILRFMPLQLSGVGANFRRIIYGADDEHLSYDDLGKQFASKYTLSDLIKYNNLLIEYLFMDPKIRV